MIKAVMFDMDGVLIDSEPGHHAVTCEVLARRGLPVPDTTEWEAVFFGRPDRDGLAEWFLLHHLGESIEDVMAELLTLFQIRFAELVPPFDDGQWLARELHRAGVPLALVSGARRAEIDLVIEAFDLGSVFAATISADDVAAGKPDPTPSLAGAAGLGVGAVECVVIEDAIPGVRSAEAAGSHVIVVDRLGRPERFETVWPVDRLDQQVLDDILRRVRGG